MAVPATLDLNITRGDTESIVVSLTQDDQTTPINITGRTYTAQLRTNPDIAIVSASFVCTVTNGSNGEVTCVMSSSESAELRPGYYYWDLQENASSVISTVLRGTVTVDADVTR
jgi:hypothetical protein